MKQIKSSQTWSPPFQPGASDQNTGAAAAQTFASDVFVPLLQNVLGGLAVMGAAAIVATAIPLLQDSSPDLDPILAWSALLGGLVTCTATVVRFFGDDLGIVRTAYRHGQERMLARVHALELELQTTRSQLARSLSATGQMPPTKALQELERAHQVAQKMIQWHFEGIPIDRRSCEQRSVGQRDWRRARQLLLAAGVMDDTGLLVGQIEEAQRLAHVHYRKAAQLGLRSSRFVPPQ